jgi:hypothetical protein
LLKRVTSVIVASIGLLFLALTPATMASADALCSQLAQQTGGCPTSSGSINGSGVDLSGHQSFPGYSGHEESREASGDDGVGNSAGPSTDDGWTPKNALDQGYGVICGPPACPTPGAKPGKPAVTLRDLASFHPAHPTSVSEPGGWAVTGLDANFVARAAPQVLNGTLLGRAAQVRFTPVRFHWAFGEGAERAADTPGATWKQLGLPEFSPTATSHVYRDAARFSVVLTVGYSPEYRLGNAAWQPVAGVLDLSAPPFTVIAGDAQTVLVGRDCVQNANGPGC